jgi:hypothetical protein
VWKESDESVGDDFSAALDEVLEEGLDGGDVRSVSWGGAVTARLP